MSLQTLYAVVRYFQLHYSSPFLPISRNYAPILRVYSKTDSAELKQTPTAI